MKKSILSICIYALIFCLPTLLVGAEHFLNKNARYLTNRLAKTDARYPSFLLVLELLEYRKAKILVETGTARDGDQNFSGDGGSTIIFADWASSHNALLSTVDISSNAIENAKISTLAYKENVRFFCSDSILYLQNFDRPIDFLYLDSFDFDFTNPLPSQEHHLKEIEAAYPKLHAKSIVMIDDCDLPHGGKGKLAIDFLLQKDWIIIYNGYQVILTR